MSANPYYPVTTSSDSTHLTDDDWGLSFSSSKRASVSRFKSLCQKVEQRPKCVLAIFLSVCIFLLICIIILVAATKGREAKHPTGNEAKRIFQTTGLNFYPIPDDGTILIRFDPTKPLKNDDAIKHTLDAATEAYMLTKQVGPEFIVCNATYHPYNKSCQYTRNNFGRKCFSGNDYGYTHGSPCVLIQLDLPNDMTIKPMRSDSTHMNSHDLSSIPITCAGSTSEDQELFEKVKVLDGQRVEYFPESGFPAYLYRPRNVSLPFVKPAVMVWIPSLPNRHVLHLTCTAWGQLYGQDGNKIKHSLLSTTFAFYQEFGKPQ